MFVDALKGPPLLPLLEKLLADGVTYRYGTGEGPVRPSRINSLGYVKVALWFVDSDAMSLETMIMSVRRSPLTTLSA